MPVSYGGGLNPLSTTPLHAPDLVLVEQYPYGGAQ